MLRRARNQSSGLKADLPLRMRTSLGSGLSQPGRKRTPGSEGHCCRLRLNCYKIGILEGSEPLCNLFTAVTPEPGMVNWDGWLNDHPPRPLRVCALVCNSISLFLHLKEYLGSLVSCFCHHTQSLASMRWVVRSEIELPTLCSQELESLHTRRKTILVLICPR